MKATETLYKVWNDDKFKDLMLSSNEQSFIEECMKRHSERMIKDFKKLVENHLKGQFGTIYDYNMASIKQEIIDDINLLNVFN